MSGRVRTLKPGRAVAVGCEELGLLAASGCCGLSHSAGRYSPGRFTLGPCPVTLPGGRAASVCCAGKGRLLGRTGT